MVRTKRAKSPEARLESALAPGDKQPYTVPENWCWVRAAALMKPMEAATHYSFEA